ncbi:metallophosphoesterase [Aquirufa sp. 2-AUSEE-184A6]|jgi:acid phosphatase type 7|uniref:Metallophosphoesterase n=1 Tax=Aquirufa novilacunae TaxID=3139305 RepID=A0ABW8T1G6_9BACT
MKKLLLLLLSLSAFGQTDSIVRGPYLQSMTSESVIIQWRTATPMASRILFGENSLNQVALDTNQVIDHVLKVGGLKTNKTYSYSISEGKGGKFHTKPKAGDPNSVRVWALGDFGYDTPNQKAVLNAVKNYTAKQPIDAWIWLGDNAYNTGKEEEYQKYVFDVYGKDFFPNLALYPAPGNHDYAGKHDPTKPPYFTIFTLPMEGQSGGVPSHSESYYSVDYGSLHLISLDTELRDAAGNQVMDGKGDQYDWLAKDLAANRLPFTIVYFHKPPYSKGSHDSDTELDMKNMREKVNPVFEKYKVDIVLAGHSHVYERTLPLRGHFGINDTFDASKQVVATEKSPNHYIVGKNGQGVIYIVNGSGGKLGGREPGFPLKSAVYTNTEVGGSMIIDVTNTKLEAKWLAADGLIRDQFIIEKR